MKDCIDAYDIDSAARKTAECIDKLHDPEAWMNMEDPELIAMTLSDFKLQAARDLELQLTVLKLKLGQERFDQLPAFTRALREASSVIDEKTERK